MEDAYKMLPQPRNSPKDRNDKFYG